MKKTFLLMLLIFLPLFMILAGCESHDYAGDSLYEEEDAEMKMIVNVNGAEFRATLENNSTANALSNILKDGALSLRLRDYGGFEKVGSLGRSLPTNNKQITTRSGDIVLYQGNQIVMFYGSNTWSYTMLGHIDDLTGWENALGSSDVTVIFSIEK